MLNETILVVDDEAEIADLVALYLENESYHVLKFYNGIDALYCMETEKPDLAILDIMMPGIDGLSLCRTIREKRQNYPVIFLTAKGEDVDKINGLVLGADDYITKPFNPLEVVARVKAQLRRYKKYNESGADEQIFESGGLFINRDSHECTLHGKPLSLTPIEFEILWLLCENQGRVVSSETIFEKVWGEKYLDCNNTVMVHIRRIREKMQESPRDPKFIKTVWGVGYKIEKNRP